MRVANWAMGSSRFAIKCLVLRPRWTTGTTTAPVSDGEGTTRRLRRAHEAQAVGFGGRRALPEPPAHEAREEEPHERAERRQQGLNLEREAILQPAVPEAAGYFLGAQYTDHHRPVAGQAFDHDLPALRHGHLQRLGRPAPPRPVVPHGREASAWDGAESLGLTLPWVRVAGGADCLGATAAVSRSRAPCRGASGRWPPSAA